MNKTQKDLKLEKNRSGQVEKKNLKKAKPAGPKNLKNSKEQQEMEDQWDGQLGSAIMCHSSTAKYRKG